jgi:23S rRNA (guanine2445-N2)-methyltransferase / 23S rRNA (guanine2069-N7)-methyltransferase
MFANRLSKNLKHLRRWAAREDVHCYRLYDADLPEYAVAVDLYDGWAHVQEYAPPSTVDPVRARRRLNEVMAVVPEVLEIPVDRVVLKVRRQQRGSEQYQKLRDEGGFLEVREGGLRFLVNLTDYLDTGLFLDHRLTRRLIRELAAGRRFLNLFAYTGSATVYAAAGGAASTTTVDLSLTYLDWARRNLDLNGFTGPEHGFVRGDCLEWLTQAGPGRRRGPAGPSGAGPFDLIFLDAPTFSNSKSMAGTLDIQRDHPWLIKAATDLLSPEGILLFSTNFRRFKLDPSVAEAYQVVDITKQTIPPDFVRNPRIHTCYRIQPAGGPGAG